MLSFPAVIFIVKQFKVCIECLMYCNMDDSSWIADLTANLSLRDLDKWEADPVACVCWGLAGTGRESDCAHVEPITTTDRQKRNK